MRIFETQEISVVLILQDLELIRRRNVKAFSDAPNAGMDWFRWGYPEGCFYVMHMSLGGCEGYGTQKFKCHILVALFELQVEDAFHVVEGIFNKVISDVTITSMSCNVCSEVIPGGRSIFGS